MNRAAKIILTKPETWQFRRAQTVDSQLLRAIYAVCERNINISACYLLDSRKGNEGEEMLTIAAALDNASQMDEVATQFQHCLRAFPAIAENTVIMSAEAFERDYAGARIYVRTGGLKRFVRSFLS